MSINLGDRREVVHEDGEARVKKSDASYFQERPDELIDLNMYELFAQCSGAKYAIRTRWAVPIVSPYRALDLADGEDNERFKLYCEQRLRLFKRGWRTTEDLTGGAEDADWVVLYREWVDSGDAPLMEARAYRRAVDNELAAVQKALRGDQEGAADGGADDGPCGAAAHPSESEALHRAEARHEDADLYNAYPEFEPPVDEVPARSLVVNATVQELAATFDHCRDGSAGKWLDEVLANLAAEVPAMPTPRLSQATLMALEGDQLLAVQMVVETFQRSLAAGDDAEQSDLGAQPSPFVCQHACTRAQRDARCSVCAPPRALGSRYGVANAASPACARGGWFGDRATARGRQGHRWLREVPRHQGDGERL